MTTTPVRPARPLVDERVLEIFFGCTRQDIADDVFLTPIPAFYRALVDSADEVVEHAGWWRLAVARRGSQRYCVVLHFEGTRVVDPLRALSGPRSRFAFLGLVGGLGQHTREGALVRITSAARLPGGVASCGGPEGFDTAFAAVRALTGNGLLDDPGTVRARAAGINAAVVDLETYFFFEALGASEGLALGLVTDRPGETPFWDVPLDDGDLAAAGAAMASAVLRSWSETNGYGGRHG